LSLPGFRAVAKAPKTGYAPLVGADMVHAQDRMLSPRGGGERGNPGRGVSEGALTPGDAAEISKLVKGFVRTLEISAFEAGLAALKERGRGETNRESPATFGTSAGE
jgi:hypothetical protein